MKILVVDDEKQLCEALVEILRRKNYAVDFSLDGESGLDNALTGIYDLIILDIMLPKKSGFEVLQELRRQKIPTPVLLLSAKGEVNDKIEGLDLGADDYLTKPFSSDELLARVRALSRRKGEYTGDELSFFGLVLDRDHSALRCKQQSVTLSAKEFEIMDMLMRADGHLIEKERFVEKIWGYDTDAEYNTIEVYVSFLRKKLTAIDTKVQIKTLRGLGYKLEGEL